MFVISFYNFPCSLARQILNEASQLTRPGVRTQEISDLVTRLAFEAGAYPSPLTVPGRGVKG